MIQTHDQIFSSQMSVAFQHLHALVAANCGNFLVRESCLNKSTHGFMSQVMKAKVLQSLHFLDSLPHPVELVRSPNTITTRFSEEDQIRIFRPLGIRNRLR